MELEKNTNALIFIRYTCSLGLLFAKLQKNHNRIMTLDLIQNLVSAQ